MDFRVGAPPPAGSPAGRAGEGQNQLVEAKVLSVRGPRTRSKPTPGRGERRGKSASRDPAGGRIVVLLIPEGYRVPAGLDSGNYRVFLRFVRR